MAKRLDIASAKLTVVFPEGSYRPSTRLTPPSS